MNDPYSDGSRDREIMRRILWHIMPLSVASLVISAIDRVNIGFAKLGMLEDLGFSEAVFALGASLFYVGYVAFEIPSAMAAYRYGARLWFARIMVTWSITTLLLAVVASVPAFYVLRFLLGAAEAGLYPALVFYLTLWFPPTERARAMGYLTLGSAFGNGLSALLCGMLLDLDGQLGLTGWQWIFLVTGLLPLVTTVLVLRYLPNKPEDARFLTEAEKRRVKTLVARGQADNHAHAHVLSVLLRPMVWGFGLLYGIFLGSLYGVNYWMPTVLREFGVSGTMNGVMIALPWAFDAVLLVLIMPRLRSGKSVHGALLTLAILAVLSFAAAASSGSGLLLKGAALMIGIPAISICIACFWTIPVRHFSGAHAAAAIGGISTIGNLGGVATLNLMPALASHLGTPADALWVPSLGMMVIALWALWLILRSSGRGGVGVPVHEGR